MFFKTRRPELLSCFVDSWGASSLHRDDSFPMPCIHILFFESVGVPNVNGHMNAHVLKPFPASVMGMPLGH